MPESPSRSVLCPVLIGRAAQVSVLSRLLDQASRGQGQIVLISGEAGIGKSRLVAEAKKLASAQGFSIRQGHCFEPDRVLPYAPLLDLLCSLPAEDVPPDDLGALLAGTCARPDEEPDQTKRRLFDTLTTFLIPGHAQLLIFEDLHWCDDASLEFLLVLARQLVSHPTLLLLTYRSEEATTPLKQLLAQLDRTRLADELMLKRLVSADTELMIRTIFAQRQPVRLEFAARIHDLTEGNPFFIEETLKSLVAVGDIFYGEGAWTRKTLDELHIPRTVQVAVAQRAAQVSPTAWQLLTLAAVAGRRFDFSLLQKMTGQPEAELIKLLKELLHAQLVVEESAESFAFRHALTQQAVYNDLLRRERKLLHRTVAERIEQLHADNLAARLADLSFHFHRAEVWSKTLEYARRAGEQARLLHAAHAASEHFTRALEAAQNLALDAEVETGLLFRARGQTHEQLGDFEAARADYEATLVAAQCVADQRAAWQALMDLGFLWAQRDYVQAGDYFQQALVTVRSMNDPRLLAHTLKRLGNWHMNVEELDEAVQLLNEALQLFEALNDQRGLAETLDLLGIAHYASANAVDGSRYYQQAIAGFRQLGDPGSELNSLAVYAPRHCVYINNAAVWPQVGLTERRHDGDTALALARKLGAKPAEALALIWPGNTVAIAGDYEPALAQVQQGLTLAEEIEHLHFITTAHMVLGAIYWDLLLWAEAQTHLERALDFAARAIR